MSSIYREQVYTSKIIKASGLLADIKTLFYSWNEGGTVDENFQNARLTNIFGKASRSRIEDILIIFRKRYCSHGNSDLALRRLVRSALPSEITDRILYYYAALDDAVVYDFVTEYLYGLYKRGRQVVTQEDALEFVENAIVQGRVASPWGSEETRLRVAQGLLSTLRDFHVLQGTKGSSRKTFAPNHLPVEVLVYIAFDIRQSIASGERILQHPYWKLFLIDVDIVERLFIEAHQLGYLRYEAAGSVIRIEFPYKDFVGLVDTLIERWKIWDR